MKDAFRFGTVGSPHSTPKKPGGTVGGILRTAELGLGALELAWVQSVRVSEETCESIRQVAIQQGIKLSVHAPYFINLNASRQEWPRSRKRLMDAANYGHLAGATDIVFHPGSYFGGEPTKVLEVVLPRLRACVEELRRNGNDVILRPETMGKSAMLGSLEDVLIMSKEIEGVRPCLDFAHLHARPGDGSINSYGEWQGVLKRVDLVLGGRALKELHIHLSGIEYGPKGERNHLPLKDADIRVRELLKVFLDLDCGGRILCESPVLENDALALLRQWNRLMRPLGEPARPILHRQI
ncbi:MAG: TIM barrel protein [Anaerolineales bacterium]